MANSSKLCSLDKNIKECGGCLFHGNSNHQKTGNKIQQQLLQKILLCGWQQASISQNVQANFMIPKNSEGWSGPLEDAQTMERFLRGPSVKK